MTIAPLTIAAGESLSDSINLSTSDVTAILTPDAWPSGVELSFQVSPDNVKFYDLSHVDALQPFLLLCAAKQWIPITSGSFPKNSYLKIRSGHPLAPVVQDADRVFQVITE